MNRERELVRKTGKGKMKTVVGVVNNGVEGAELVGRAGDGDGSVVVEPMFLLGLLQQLHEERVVHINHRDHEPLLLLAHENGHEPLWNLLAPVPLVEMKVEIEMQVVVLVAAEPHRELESPKRKREEKGVLLVRWKMAKGRKRRWRG